MKIKDFFNSINREIKNAHTEKALRILSKRTTNFKDAIMRNETSHNLKRSALQEYKRVKNNIDNRSKQI